MVRSPVRPEVMSLWVRFLSCGSTPENIPMTPMSFQVPRLKLYIVPYFVAMVAFSGTHGSFKETTVSTDFPRTLQTRR